MSNRKRNQITLLVFLIIALFFINYNFLDEKLEDFLANYEIIDITRVIDGDTVVTLINGEEQSIRLLGINTPERGEVYYEEAKDFLQGLVGNKSVKLVFGKQKYDLYQRMLGYLYIGEENINIKLVEKGFANSYFPSGKDIYYNSFKEAWEECLEKNINLCEKSENICVNCIELKEFNYKSQEVVFYNKCDFDCELTNWKIKDEGRKNFIFEDFVLESKKEVLIKVSDGEDNEDILFWKDEDYVWTSTGDSLFLRDSEEKFVLWESF